MVNVIAEVNQLYVKIDGRSFWVWVEEKGRIARTFLGSSDVEELCTVLISGLINVFEMDLKELRKRIAELEEGLETVKGRPIDERKFKEDLEYFVARAKAVEEKLRTLRRAHKLLKGR